MHNCFFGGGGAQKCDKGYKESDNLMLGENCNNKQELYFSHLFFQQTLKALDQSVLKMLCLFV